MENLCLVLNRLRACQRRSNLPITKKTVDPFKQNGPNRRVNAKGFSGLLNNDAIRALLHSAHVI